MKLKVISYNIHKGFDPTNFRLALSKIKALVAEQNADLVLLQEVTGANSRHEKTVKDWPRNSQFEYLADSLWPHYSYGKNSAYTEGHHGNAILSKFPILWSHNQDISAHRFERRGMLHIKVELPHQSQPLHVICTHLGLFEVSRHYQAKLVSRLINAGVPRNEPLIIGGDFNDWRERLSVTFRRNLGVDEAFLSRGLPHPRTFPSYFPVFRLDRLYFRGFKCTRAEVLSKPPWSTLSDHLPVQADFELD